jgi:multiple sugar transport system substrate-binding protein
MQRPDRLLQPSIRHAFISLLALSLFASACNFPAAAGTLTQVYATAVPVASTQTPTATGTATPIPTATIPAELASLKDTNIKIIHPWADQAGVEFRKLISEFNEENIWKIHVDEVHGGSVSETARLFTDSMETSDRLDMVAISPEYLVGWVTTGFTIDLSPFSSNPEWGLPEAEKKTFLSQVWDANSFDEKLIGIPAQINLQFLVYNQTWAKELGFSEAPHTQNDFVKQVCEAAHTNNFDSNKDNDGTGGWIINSSSPILLSWINAFGGSKAWSRDSQISFNQAETGNAFTYLRSLTEKGCAWNSRVASPFTYFASRQSLAISATLPDLMELEETMSFAKNADKWVILPYPGEENSSPALMTGLSFGISKSNPNNELASWLFMRWLMLPRNQARLAEAAGSIPPTSTAADLMTAFGEHHDWWLEAEKLVPEAVMLPASSNWRQIRPVLEDGFWQMLQPTPMAIPTLLEQMNETIKSIP